MSADVWCKPQFVSKWIWLFNKYFLILTLKLTFLTPFTYSLTPSTFNLVNAIATASKQLFTMRSLHTWGRSFSSFCTLNEIKSLLLRTLLLVERSVYDQSSDLSHIVEAGVKYKIKNKLSRSSALSLTNLCLRQHFWLVAKWVCQSFRQIRGTVTNWHLKIRNIS